MGLADEDVLQWHRQRFWRAFGVPGLGPPALEESGGLAGVDAAANGVARVRREQRLLNHRGTRFGAHAKVVLGRREERRTHPHALRAECERRGDLAAATDAGRLEHRVRASNGVTYVG